MTRCKNNSIGLKNMSIGSFRANDLFIFNCQIDHFFVEPEFTSGFDDLFLMAVNDMWQFIGPYVWM
jgi:hypothetical protein